MINKDLLDSAADSLFYNLFDLRRVGVPGRQNHIRRLGHQMDHIADFLLEISLFIRQCDRPLLKRHPGRGKCSSRFVEFHVLPRRNRGQPDDFDPEIDGSLHHVWIDSAHRVVQGDASEYPQRRSVK